MNFKNNNIYIIYLLILPLLISCGSGHSVLKKDNKNIKKEVNINDIIKTNEEKQFFNDNIVPKIRKGFYDVFFSFVEGDYNKFYKLSKKFMNDIKSPKVLKLWIALKYFNLFKKDIISYEDVKDFYLDNLELKFIPLLMKELELLYSRMFMLDNTNIKTLYLLNKWTMSGPYKITNNKTLSDFNFHNKYGEVFVKNKSIYFRKGGITVPDNENKIYGAIYKFTSNIYINDDEMNLYFVNAPSMFFLKIDDKIVFNNESIYKVRSRDVVNIKLNKGVHKFKIVLANFNKEIFIYSDKKIQFKNKNIKMVKSDIKFTSLTNKLIKNIFNINNNFSYSFKNIIASEIMFDMTNNIDKYYKYLISIQKNNFYVDYLYYNYYSNYIGVSREVKNKYMQKYIKKSIKKNSKFYKTKMENILLQDKPNPYQVLDDLKGIRPSLWYYNLLTLYYKKANLLKDYNDILYKISNMRNGELFLYKYFSKDLILYDYDLYKKIYNKFKNKLIYKKQYSKKDINYFLKKINNAPYSLDSLYFLSILKDINDSLIPKTMFKNFISEYMKLKINLSNKDLIKLINNKNSKYFIKADLFLKKWNKYIKFEDVSMIINNFRKLSIKEDFPTTKLLDYDIAFIEKNYWVLLNRRIIKINNSEGLRKYSNLSRRRNYLKIVTISKDDLKEYTPSYVNNTSEISLKKLKIGDYIELITYQKSIITPKTDLTNLVNFRYKDFNQTVINAKLDLYINNYFAKGKDKLYLNPRNNFDLKRIKIRKLGNYTLYTYRNQNLKGIKMEPFSSSNGLLLFPTIEIKSKNTWKNIYEKIQLYYGYLEYSNYSNEIIKKYSNIKMLIDLKKLYYKINKSMKHIDSLYGFFDLTYLNRRGNLVYFMKMILDKKNIKSNVLIFHNRYNFLDKKDIPTQGYYNVFILRVKYNNAFYYLDFSSKWNEFNRISPLLYGEYYLRIDDDGNIFKEKLKKVSNLVTKTNLKITVNDDYSANFNIKMIVPSILSGSLKNFISSKSKERVSILFNFVLSKSLGTMRNFKVDIKNENTPKLPLIIKLSFIKDNFVERHNNELIITDILDKELSRNLYSFALLKDYTVLSNRTLPLFLYYFNNSYTLNIEFPKSFKVLELNTINEKNKFAEYIVKSKIKGNFFELIRKYRINISKVKVDDYNLLKLMSERIKKFKKQNIIAKKIK